MTTYDETRPDTWPIGIFTCHTAGCINDGVPVEMAVPVTPEDHLVLCGGCNTFITDKHTKAL